MKRDIWIDTYSRMAVLIPLIILIAAVATCLNIVGWHGLIESVKATVGVWLSQFGR